MFSLRLLLYTSILDKYARLPFFLRRPLLCTYNRNWGKFLEARGQQMYFHSHFYQKRNYTLS